MTLSAYALTLLAAVWLLCWLFSDVAREWLAFWLIVLAIAALLLFANQPREIDFRSPNPDLAPDFK